MKGSKHIQKIIQSLPQTPGVYHFIDKKGEIIYIGKSKSLKNRVSSYFQSGRSLSNAKLEMVSQVDDIKIIHTNTDLESLMLETTLIKKHTPKYNILMKDDKNYLYIKVTKEKYPKIIATRLKTGKGTFYGPFIRGNYVYNILRLAKKIFGYGVYGEPFFRQSKKSYNLDKYIFSSDEKSNIKTEQEKIAIYREKIAEIETFLKGNIDEVIQKLTDKMMNHAQKLEFEQAAKIKYDIESLKILQSEQIVRDTVAGNYDVINVLNKYDNFGAGLLTIRNGKITGYENIDIENYLEEDIGEILTAITERRYAEVITRGEKNFDGFILPDSIHSDIIPSDKIEVPKIGNKLSLLKLCYKNIYEHMHKAYIASLSTKNFTKKTMLELLDMLGYESINKDVVFECNDISHLSGTHTVASRSIIENGRKNPQKYRKFNIKTLSEGKIDDFGSMREIMTRRLLEIEKTGYVPDLIIIDGGKGQLSSVLEILENTKKTATGEFLQNLNKLQLVSIAKREEELFLPHNPVSVILEKDSPHLRLVQAIRDEAHRFAITFNRQKRIKETKSSILERVPGIGPKTRKKIYNKFGSLESLKSASISEVEKQLGKHVTEILEVHGFLGS